MSCDFESKIVVSYIDRRSIIRKQTANKRLKKKEIELTSCRSKKFRFIF